MNLLAKRKLGWLLWLTPFLFSCESDDILSLPQEPGDQTLNLYYTELALPFTLAQIDSINTTNTSQSPRFLLSGQYSDESFGTTQATGFTSFRVTTLPSAIESNATFDSLVLTTVHNYFYGLTGESAIQQLSVHLLSDTIERRIRYSQETIDFDPTPIGSLNFSTGPEVIQDADTLRIRLDNLVGSNLLDSIKGVAPDTITNTQLSLFIPGVALVPSEGSNVATGFNPDQTSLIVYYKNPGDTTSRAYAMGTNLSFSNISADRTNTPLAPLATSGISAMAEDGHLYLQSSVGLAPRISFKPLLQFIDSIETTRNAQLRLNSVRFQLRMIPYLSSAPPPPALSFYTFNTYETEGYLTRETNYTTFLAPLNSSSNSPAIARDSLTVEAELGLYLQTLAETRSDSSEFILLGTGFERTLNQFRTQPDSIFLKIQYTLLE